MHYIATSIHSSIQIIEIDVSITYMVTGVNKTKKHRGMQTSSTSICLRMSRSQELRELLAIKYSIVNC